MSSVEEKEENIDEKFVQKMSDENENDEEEKEK